MKISANDLKTIPGIGKSIENDLKNIGINCVDDLVGRDPENLYDLSNKNAGCIQDRCLLYVFRCAVYFAETPAGNRNEEKLKWWYWKNGK